MDSFNTCANTVTWKCHSNPKQVSRCFTRGTHAHPCIPMLSHHSHDKVRFGNEFILEIPLCLY
ncbi:hypothetical protein I79_011244 [Cricetulus griseus]|uniref:Uncharacterized protein n=1 Tax=Cricetulus griseus TaxID=10029 RepID=G3HKL5_CRIGR|nr:hypothetical protein I79_011244 [Cricetulus griseus]